MFTKSRTFVFFSLLNIVFFSGCGGSSKPTIVQNTASNSNSSPVITSSAVNTAFIGSTYQYPVKASDKDTASILSYHLFSAPDGMQINTYTGLITWIPTIEQIGNHIVIVQVKDNGNIIKAGYQSFPVTVKTINSENSKNKLIALPDYTETYKNKPVIIDVLKNDQITSLSEGITIVNQPSNGQVKVLSDDTVFYTPKGEFTGLDHFIYMISDEFESQIANVTIAVDCPECNEDKVITLQWKPSVYGKDAGYLIYYGPNENSTNTLAYDLSHQTNLNEYNPIIQLSKHKDLKLYKTQTICFRISAYIEYKSSELSQPVCGTV